MKTVWEYSLQTEALRLLHSAHQIAVGFYKLNGFTPLPSLKNLKSDRVVSFPALPYSTIPRFWDQARKIDVSTLPISADPQLVAQIIPLLSALKLAPPHMTHVKKLWQTHQAKILRQIFDLVPAKKGQVSQILIMPTSFGTGGSFSIHRQPGDPVIIWLRADKGVAEIVEAILTSLTRHSVYSELGGLWQESEIIVDWLLSFSPLGKLLKKLDIDVSSTLTIKTTRSVQNADLVQESGTFLQSIGAPVIDISSLKNVPVNNMTHREREIFNLLLLRSPKLVTVDEIAEILFANNPEAFSLYAISKSIQRLRDKLEKNGVSGSYIQTKRGEGYLLVN